MSRLVELEHPIYWNNAQVEDTHYPPFLKLVVDQCPSNSSANRKSFVKFTGHIQMIQLLGLTGFAIVPEPRTC